MNRTVQMQACRRTVQCARTGLFALMLAFPAATFGAQGGAVLFEPLVVREAKEHRGRLGSILNGVVAAYERDLQSASKGEPAARAAGRAPMSQGASVAVTLRIDDPSKIEALTRFLKENGGDTRNVGEDYVEAYVPVALLVEASQQPGVRRVQAIIPPTPNRGPTVSEGVAVHGADRWHGLGITGRGIKVGVIDGGFRGFRALMGSELPASVVARCYQDIGRYTSNLEDCVSFQHLSYVHGTAVAEALLDVAPDVSLYIADPETNGDLKNTVDWMAAQGVQVITYTAKLPFDGPGDGTSPYSDSPLNTVDTAIEKGIVWVNAAGNEARRAWFGAFRDVDDDGRHEFDDGDERNCGGNQEFWVQLRWQGQWGSGAQLVDLDLYLYERDGDLVAKSDIDQNSPGMEVPIEYLQYEGASDHCVVVRRSDGGPAADPEWIQLFLVAGGRLDHTTGWGSINNPSESANPGLLAVGAANWSDDPELRPAEGVMAANRGGLIEYFSSRGPTPDGRLKPDIVGVDRGRSAAYGGQAFWGTSQASPHVAGLAALVRQAYPSYRPHEVAAYLKANASARETRDFDGQLAHPNNVWGHGLAALPPIHGWHSAHVAQAEDGEEGDGVRSLPLSRYFPAADGDTTFEAESSDPRLLAVAVRGGAVVLTPARDREGRATITLRALFGDGSQETVLVVVTVEDALPSPGHRSWRLALYEDQK